MVVTLRAHLDLEEAEAFTLARRVLKEEDWAAIQDEVARTIDPLLSDGSAAYPYDLQHLSSQTRT